MISKDYKYAIVGASTNPAKYGYKVLRDLKEAGFDVTPINPKGGEILGLKVKNSVSEMSAIPDVIVTIVPPDVTKDIVREAIDIDVANIWMQPGSESPDAIKLCEENGISCIYNACIMVQRRAGKES